MKPSQQQVLEDLEAFRHSFAAALERLTPYGPGRADRVAAQEGLQLIWSFVVSELAAEEELDDPRWELLREAFPDEFFEPEPDETFVELSERVPNSYAAQWKYFPSDHLCELARGCIAVGDLDAARVYRVAATRLAAHTSASVAPLSARGVFDVAQYDAVLKRLRILCEVAAVDAALPDDDEIKSFCMKSSGASALSFGFMAHIEPELAVEMIAEFAERHGTDVAAELLADALTEPLDDDDAATLGMLQHLLNEATRT